MPYVLYNFLNFLQLFTYITKIKDSNLIFIILVLNELLSDKTIESKLINLILKIKNIKKLNLKKITIIY